MCIDYTETSEGNVMFYKCDNCGNVTAANWVEAVKAGWYKFITELNWKAHSCSNKCTASIKQDVKSLLNR